MEIKKTCIGLETWENRCLGGSEPNVSQDTLKALDGPQEIMDKIHQWTTETFGPAQKKPAILHHLKEEVEETIAAVLKHEKNPADPGLLGSVLEEHADCLILLLDSAARMGFNASILAKAITGKLEENKTRKWLPPDKHGMINHVPR